MKDFFDSLRQQISDRMSSPVFGSFIIAWLCWNHRYLIVIFSDMPVQERFAFVSTRLYPDQWVLWSRTALFPALSSVAYILIYPRASKPLLAYWDRHQQELAALRNEAQKKTLLTKEESQRIILDGINERAQWDELVRKQASEIDALRNLKTDGAGDVLKRAGDQIKMLKDELDRTRAASLPVNPLGNLPAEILKGVRALLGIFAKANFQTAPRASVFEALGESQIKARVYLDKAMSAGLVEPSPQVNDVYRLTQLGREYVVKEGLDSSDPLSKNSGMTAPLSAKPGTNS